MKLNRKFTATACGLAATLTRLEANGTRSVVLAHGYRIATADPATLAQQWLRNAEAQHPGFALSGKVSVMEITRDDLAMIDLPTVPVSEGGSE